MRGNNFIERSLMGAFSFLKESIFSEEYASKKGFLQAREPRIKFVSILIFLLAVLFFRSIYFLIGMYAFCLVLAGLSSIRLGFFLKRTWIFIPLFSFFIALPALFNIFTPGEPVLSFRIFIFSLSITKQGIASASFFFMRVLTSVSLCVLLVLTTRHYILLKVLRIFRVPQVFVMTLGMCYRYVYLFIEIIENTYLAIKSRVGRVSSVKSGQGIVAWNIASLWQRSYQLNEDVYKAMLSRGYRGEPVVLNDFRIKAIDWVWLFIAILISGSVFYLTYRIKI
ncbi:MAG: cobalt ECF transporter T component CbiQ [Candidatus Omnitrophica bacterium CG23_combo_of_CG06-09_8_20_14_all_40_11]|nr:MAG: cobalt ECF transporter T component CbiQ [Candidatus Omnitrophica bacterium CG23_combo_of_CG06-09_8_20_14_all_40_11]